MDQQTEVIDSKTGVKYVIHAGVKLPEQTAVNTIRYFLLTHKFKKKPKEGDTIDIYTQIDESTKHMFE